MYREYCNRNVYYVLELRSGILRTFKKRKKKKKGTKRKITSSSCYVNELAKCFQEINLYICFLILTGDSNFIVFIFRVNMCAHARKKQFSLYVADKEFSGKRYSLRNHAGFAVNVIFNFLNER